MKKTLIVLSLLVFIGLGVITFSFQRDGFVNAFSWLSGASSTNKSSSKPASFYKTERSVKVVFFSIHDVQDPKARLSSLQKGLTSLFDNLKNDQHYDSIILLPDQKLSKAEEQAIADEIKAAFPKATLTNLNVEQSDSKEDSILSGIKRNSGENPLVIYQSFLPTPAIDPLLAEIQFKHYKNVFDNPSKSSLNTIPYTNRTSLNGVYQYAKNNQFLKALPTLIDPDGTFEIKYLSEGTGTSTKTATLTFFGDMMLGRHVRTLMDSHTLDYPFQKMDPTYLQENDLLIANLEGPIAKKAIETSKSIAFRFLPDIAPILVNHYFDVLSVANNHALDMGQQGLNDNYQILTDSGLVPFGDPRRVSELSVTKQEVNGVPFAFVGLNNTDFKLNSDEVLKTIRQLSAEGNHVIPFIHWGNEYQHTPSKDQIAMAHSYVDAGAVAVIGMHPHVVQSFEIYNDTPIFYSLGNAIFDQYFSPDVQEGLSAVLRFSPESLDVYFFPINIKKSQFSLMTGEEKEAFLKRYTSYWRYDQAIKDQIEKGKISFPVNKD